ncbi:MAG: hypothetical protein JTT15_03325 [Candidatus Brockarchaeota archaeon]|nr:hypothetical protein [Candidatus Brockarchaeota archaeon]
MAETIKAEIKPALARRFRKIAMERNKYKKGAVKAALEELIKRYVSRGKVDWKALRGCLNMKESSVELQHKAWDFSD